MLNYDYKTAVDLSRMYEPEVRHKRKRSRCRITPPKLTAREFVVALCERCGEEVTRRQTYCEWCVKQLSIKKDG